MSAESDEFRRRFDLSFLVTKGVGGYIPWDAATQAHYEDIEVRLGRAHVVIGNLYNALDGLRDRYVPNDEARPEVVAADSALDQCRRFFPEDTSPSPP